VNGKTERMRKEAVNYSGICKEGSEMTKKNLREDRRHPDRDLKLRLPQFKAEGLTTPNCGVMSLLTC
jgi:hypothetical protein